MTVPKFNKISFYLSLVISIFCEIIFIGIGYIIFNIPIEKIIKFSFLSFLSILIFSYIFLFYRLENYLINRVSKLYNSLYPNSTSTIKSASDIELLTTNLKKLNSDKNLEIELLKKQEDYRKDFIGNIAHELKTPLFTIQGYVLTLLDGGIKDKKIIKKYLKRTSKGVDRLSYVIKDLDFITKVESGMAKLDKKPFDIRLTIENVFESLEIQAKKSNINLRMNRQYNDPIFVIADEERIQQLIINLIINSLKYGVERGITEVSIEVFDKNKILIRISDNGEGIEEEHLPRLFERFYRVEKTRNKGTIVSKGKTLEPHTPCYIVKKDQVLLRLSSLDFSFIVEENISYIFGLLHEYQMPVELIQNSAISFSVCINNKYQRLEELVLVLRSKFNVSVTPSVDLYTIRHFDSKASQFIRQIGKPILLEQRTQETAQFVV